MHGANTLRHFVFSRRCIRGQTLGSGLPEHQDLKVARELDELMQQAAAESAIQSPTNLEFTLGRSLGPTLGVLSQPAGTLRGNHVFRANLNAQVSARKGDQRGSVEAETLLFDTAGSPDLEYA